MKLPVLAIPSPKIKHSGKVLASQTQQSSSPMPDQQLNDPGSIANEAAKQMVEGDTDGALQTLEKIGNPYQK